VRPGRAADHSPPSSAAVIEEQSYTSPHPLGYTGPITGSFYLYLLFELLYFRQFSLASIFLTLSSLLFSFVLYYAIKKFTENQ